MKRGTTRTKKGKTPLLQIDADGLWCEAGGFHVDPWNPVDRAVITHAHGDHMARGCGSYLGSAEGEQVMRARLLEDASVETTEWGVARTINGVQVSLHPAGHILGSAQIRVEHKGEVWVVSGDYKTEPDATCSPFEPVPCHTFITESTFGLPIYRWPEQEVIFEEINSWWRRNVEEGKASLLYGYSLGKAQRLLAGVDPSIGPIFTHGAVERLTEAYRRSEIPMPETTYIGEEVERGRKKWEGALVVAPPSAHGTPWMRKFGRLSSGFASGWMRIRGTRRRKAVDRGFVLSDHVDWPSLLDAVEATGAERVLVTHGYVRQVVRYLRDAGLDADGLETRYEGESDEESAAEVTSS